jgi:hypothetical protein
VRNVEGRAVGLSPLFSLLGPEGQNYIRNTISVGLGITEVRHFQGRAGQTPLWFYCGLDTGGGSHHEG